MLGLYFLVIMVVFPVCLVRICVIICCFVNSLLSLSLSPSFVVNLIRLSRSSPSGGMAARSSFRKASCFPPWKCKLQAAAPPSLSYRSLGLLRYREFCHLAAENRISKHLSGLSLASLLFRSFFLFLCVSSIFPGLPQILFFFLAIPSLMPCLLAS